MDTFKAASSVEVEMAVKVVARAVKVVAREVENRTWYLPEAWEHGGLMLKKEVKQEAEGESSAKRARND